MEGKTVWFLWPKNWDEPVRTGTVEQVYDDGSADIEDSQLGTLCVDLTDIFDTREEAEAEYDRRGL